MINRVHSSMEGTRKLRKRWKAAGITVLAVLWLYGCQGPYSGVDAFKPETNSIYITKDGLIFSGMVETFDAEKQGNYQQESLQNFVLEEVALFNESLGASKAAQNEEGKEPLPVAVKSCELNGSQVAAVYQYKDRDCFLAFGQQYFASSGRLNGFGVYSVEKAMAEGWLAEADLVKPLKGGEVKTLDSQELSKLNKGQVIWVETDYPVEIQVEGRIRYMTNGVALVGKDTAQVPAGVCYLIFW